MTNQKEMVSVIVPIYMIDRYVGMCVESVLNQSYNNIEVILVDDGSEDRCPEICDLYGRKDGRVKVIHKPNGGLVSARKAGLLEATGRYVTYVDGDDWVEPGFVESLVSVATSHEADIVCAGFSRDLFSKSVSFVDALPQGVYEGERLRELWRSMISHGPYYRPGISTYVWNKLFDRELLASTQMPVDNRITIGEDGAVTYPSLAMCRRAAVIGDTSYHYRQREDSMLKRASRFVDEARRLGYLYEYMTRWSEGTDPDLCIKRQVIDYVLSIAIIRSGGRLPHDDFSTFDKAYYGKRVVIYSAGTFGQQLVGRFRETGHCSVVAWVDDDYWEYRRCCLDVDPVESISQLDYDYVLIATVNSTLAEQVRTRLQRLGAEREKVLGVSVPDQRELLMARFLDVDAIRKEEDSRMRRGVVSHA